MPLPNIENNPPKDTDFQPKKDTGGTPGLGDYSIDDFRDLEQWGNQTFNDNDFQLVDGDETVLADAGDNKGDENNPLKDAGEATGGLKTSEEGLGDVTQKKGAEGKITTEFGKQSAEYDGKYKDVQSIEYDPKSDKYSVQLKQGVEKTDQEKKEIIDHFKESGVKVDGQSADSIEGLSERMKTLAKAGKGQLQINGDGSREINLKKPLEPSDLGENKKEFEKGEGQLAFATKIVEKQNADNSVTTTYDYPENARPDKMTHLELQINEDGSAKSGKQTKIGDDGKEIHQKFDLKKNDWVNVEPETKEGPDGKDVSEKTPPRDETKEGEGNEKTYELDSETVKGEVKQSIDEKGVVTTQIPESFQSDIESVTYDPNKPEGQRYSVKMKEGAEAKAEELAKKAEAVTAKLNNGETQVQSMGVKGDLFPKDWNSPEVKIGDIDTTTPELQLDGSLKFAHKNNAENSTRIYPDGRPDGLKSSSEFKDGDNTRTVNRYDASKNPDGRSYESIVRGKDGKPISGERDGIKDGKPYKETYDRENGWKRAEVEEKTEQKERPEAKDLELTGTKKAFAFGNEKGETFRDPETGFLNGIKFNEGNRKGQELKFTNDAEGNLSKLESKIPGDPPTNLTLEKGEDGKWKIENYNKDNADEIQKNLKELGFNNVEINENGEIKGEFKLGKQKGEKFANGDLVYDKGDGNLEKMRLNGTHDTFNLNRYERTRSTAQEIAKAKAETAELRKDPEKANETVAPTAATEHWDGYKWRAGAEVKSLGDNDSKVQITFPKEGNGKQTVVTLDNSTNDSGKRVNDAKFQLADGRNYDPDGNWNKMTKQAPGKEAETLYYSGIRDSQTGKRVWMRGSQGSDGKITLQPRDRAQQAKFDRNALPNEVKYNPDGTITRTYPNRNKVTADNNGYESKYEYLQRDGKYKTVELDRDSYGRVQNATFEGKKYDNVEESDTDKKLKLKSAEGDTEIDVKDGSVIGKDKDGNLIRGTDSSGQEWSVVKDGEGKEKWQAKSADGTKSETFDKPEGSKLVKLSDGRFGIKEPGEKGKIKSKDLGDGTELLYNHEGKELERNFADGSHIHKNEDGSLKEIKSKVIDGEGKESFEVKQFKTGKGPDGKDIKYVADADGKPLGYQIGTNTYQMFKEPLKDAAALASVSQDNLESDPKKALLETYDPANGTRILQTLDDAKNNSMRKTLRFSNGNHVRYDEKGAPVEARIKNEKTNVLETLKDGVTIREDLTSGNKWRLKDVELKGDDGKPIATGKVNPKEIYQIGKDGKEHLIARPTGPNGELEVYPNQLGKDASETAPEKGKGVEGRLLPDGTIEYPAEEAKNDRPQTHWRVGLNGAKQLGVKSGNDFNVVMETNDKGLQRFRGLDGKYRNYVRNDDGKVTEIKLDDGTVTSKLNAEGKLEQFKDGKFTGLEDPYNPKFIDAKTGIYTMEVDAKSNAMKLKMAGAEAADGDGSEKVIKKINPNMTIDTFDSKGQKLSSQFPGGEIVKDGEGKVVEDEAGNPKRKGAWTETYENGELKAKKITTASGMDVTESYKDGKLEKRAYGHGRFTDYMSEDGTKVTRKFGGKALMEFDVTKNRVTRSVDAKGIERTFGFGEAGSASEKANQVQKITVRDTNNPDAEPTTEVVGEKGFFHPVTKEHPGGDKSVRIKYERNGVVRTEAKAGSDGKFTDQKVEYLHSSFDPNAKDDDQASTSGNKDLEQLAFSLGLPKYEIADENGYYATLAAINENIYGGYDDRMNMDLNSNNRTMYA